VHLFSNPFRIGERDFPTIPDLFVVKHQVIAKVQKNYHITLGENYHH